ncbi:MAG: hypothetical protein H6850_02105 [Alphaproteobacteria bacterium]|nr:MAG: hypothetical protein H6850_02105 [Alphaproteobacteria bacterium]
MKQNSLFAEEEKLSTAFLSPASSEQKFPDITLSNLLSDQFINENGMFGLRMLLKRARKRGQIDQYKRVLNAEIEMKKGENTLKNNLRHAMLWDLMAKKL